MSSKASSSGEDISFLLYLLPPVAGIVYWLYERFFALASISNGSTFAYLVVAKDPYLFIGSVAAICLAVIIELRGAPLAGKQHVVSENSSRMNWLAIAVLVISFIGGVVSSGGDFVSGAGNFVSGRSALIFAFFLIVFSVLLSPKQLFGTTKIVQIWQTIGIFLLAVSPVVFYGALKIHLSFPVSAIGAIVVAAIGIVLVLGSFGTGKKPTQVTPPQAKTAS